MKRLEIAAREYLAVRRAMGFKLRHQTWWLPDFVAFLSAQRSTVITQDLAVRWAMLPATRSRTWWRCRLSAIRGFARYRLASDPRTEVPSTDLIPREPRQRFVPYLYSAADIARLMDGARALDAPLRATTYASVLGLLAATGMRVAEALSLGDDDIDWTRGILTIREGKFGKSRHVPLHETTVVALKRYAKVRNSLLRVRHRAGFFVSSTGARVLHQNFHREFLRLLRSTGVGRDARRRPRLHDLRHTFAVNTLKDWYRRGYDVEQRLPVLSTYLGHVSPATTYWYLTATPELLTVVSRRALRAWEERP